MDNEFLWNRSGESPEIERLEGLLQELRYVPTTAPELPAAAASWWQSLRIITLAAAAATVLIFGWMMFFSPKQTTPMATVVVPDAVQAPSMAPITVEHVNPATEQRPTYSNALYVKRRPAKAHRKGKQTPVVLTAEEKHAYDQVVLALFITGSKLKSVRDTIDTLEKNDARSNDR